MDIHTEYDSAGRAVKSTRVVDDVTISATRTEYDASGQTVATVDMFGLRTEYVYDKHGQQIETRREAVGSDGVKVWLVSRTVYDGLGRVTWESEESIATGPAATPRPGKATYTVYDIFGNSDK